MLMYLDWAVEQVLEKTLIDSRVAQMGKSSSSDSFRKISAGSGVGAVNAGRMSKLRNDYHTSTNHWPGCELLIAVVTTGARAHADFLAAIRQWCHRAAERQVGTSALPVATVGDALARRVSGILGISLHRTLHRLASSTSCPGTYVSKRDAGPVDHWETAVGAAWEAEA